jgi:thioredoxin 1
VQQSARRQAVECALEADRRRARRLGRSERARKRLRRFDARRLRSATGPRTPRERQVLGERQQHDGIAQADGALVGPVHRDADHFGPGIRDAPIEGVERYRCHSQEVVRRLDPGGTPGEPMCQNHCASPRFRGSNMSSDLIQHTSDAAFDSDVLKADKPVLVDYWAEWCGPCKMIAPILDEVSKDYDGRLKVAKMNVDENRDVPAKFGIRGIPTLMLFKDGQLAATKVGALSKAQLTAFIDSHL